MSRKNWQDRLSAKYGSSDWRHELQHIPLKGRTTDPEALDFDEAVVIFRNGLSCARSNDFDAGRALVATAFLLDTRSIKFAPLLPEPDDGLTVLDGQLLVELSENDPEPTFSKSILRVMMAHFCGSDPQEGQVLISLAMKELNSCLSEIELDPSLEDPKKEMLGGCFTRPNLLYLRSSLYMAIGNHKKALQDHTKALEIDPKCLKAREARASVWGSSRAKDLATLHAEYKLILSQAHPDNRGNEVSYAWMAILTLEDARLGTYNEAKSYYEKSIRASARRSELYGARPVSQNPPILSLMQAKFRDMKADPVQFKLRQDTDISIAAARAANVSISNDFSEKPSKRMQHSCLKCGKFPAEAAVEKLLQCGQCRQVNYCSRECQKEDWKSHKVFCKTMAASAQSTSRTSGLSPPTSVSQKLKPQKPMITSTPKEPVEVSTSRKHAADRMKRELMSRFLDRGKNFANWWREQTSKEKTEILLEATGETIPMKAPSEFELSSADAESTKWLMEYNVENLLGSCSCTGSDHLFNDMILHEIYVRALNPHIAESEDFAFCSGLRMSSKVPSMFSSKISFIKPAEDGGPDYDGTINVATDKAAPKQIQTLENYLAQGVLHDATAVRMTLMRQIISVGLLIKVFDIFEVTRRRMKPRHPYERLLGCEYCLQTCESDEASSCSVCEAQWFCCQGCKTASNHSIEACSGVACDSAVRFH